jgi:threonine dehydrogenase-like Zn-dependent dehydrogenase
VDVAIESTGSKSALDLALRTTKAGGRVVLSGIPARAPTSRRSGSASLSRGA